MASLLFLLTYEKLLKDKLEDIFKREFVQWQMVYGIEKTDSEYFILTVNSLSKKFNDVDWTKIGRDCIKENF